ncbi:MAG: carbon-nitrogen hydrolase family protein [Gammaproteobacteria bacterium]|nr:carbon-nitrogen hydrolase family protein [Gammaproteobacteria bacterium]
MRVAVYQCRSWTADVERNLSRLEHTARGAAADGARILVCPELMLTGYNIGRDRIRALAEPADGPSAERIAAIAAETGIAIVYGYPERAGDETYNAAQLIDRNGTARLNYRKTHLFGDAEREAFTAGTDLSRVTDVDGWTIGLMVCYDVEFPEAVRLLALAGADLVLVPTALMQPYDGLPDVLIPARAYENQLYLAYANYWGTEGDLSYCGSSVIASPDGRCLAHAGAEEELFSTDISRDALASSRRINTYLADRRPALYGALISKRPDP